MLRLSSTRDALKQVASCFPLAHLHASLLPRRPFLSPASARMIKFGMLPNVSTASVRFSYMRISTLQNGKVDEVDRRSGLFSTLEAQFDPVVSPERQHNPSLYQNKEEYLLKPSTAVHTDVDQTSGNPVGKICNGYTFSEALNVLKSKISNELKPTQNSRDITKRLLDRLDMKPILEKMRFVHIAGTKGKGTTAAYTSAILRTYGFKVGLFTSPHLLDVRERILINNSMLREDTFARYFFELHEKLELLKYSERDLDRDDASNTGYFIFLFLLCLHAFAAEHVEVAVIEVGIGGRVDATEVIPSEVSVITALGYDHMELLGSTIELISREKAAIMKPNTVCFASPQRDHPEARSELEKVARETRTAFIFLDDKVFPIKVWPTLAIGGDHAIENSKLAFMAARQIVGVPPVLPLSEAEQAVFRTMKLIGRSQIIALDDCKDCIFYLDGAHTVESLQHATRWFLKASFASSIVTHSTSRDGVRDDARRVLVFFTLRDPSRTLKAFMPFVSNFCKTIIAQVPVIKPPVRNVSRQIATSRDKNCFNHCETGFNENNSHYMHERLVETTECWRNLYREVPCLPCMEPFESLNDILNLVLPPASDSEDPSKPVKVFVCGSFYLVANVLQLIRTQLRQAHCK